MTLNFWTVVCVHAIVLRLKYKKENKMHQWHQQWKQNVKSKIGFKSLFQAWVGYFHSSESTRAALHFSLKTLTLCPVITLLFIISHIVH